MFSSQAADRHEELDFIDFLKYTIVLDIKESDIIWRSPYRVLLTATGTQKTTDNNQNQSFIHNDSHRYHEKW